MATRWRGPCVRMTKRDGAGGEGFQGVGDGLVEGDDSLDYADVRRDEVLVAVAGVDGFSSGREDDEMLEAGAPLFEE